DLPRGRRRVLRLPAVPQRLGTRAGPARGLDAARTGWLAGRRGEASMTEFLAGIYPWLKALHVLSVIAWMAGMLYLPRLFVYHAQAEAGSQISETFKVMERRLLRAII